MTMSLEYSRIVVYVPQAVALAAGQVKYGEHEYMLQPEDMAYLLDEGQTPKEECQWLVRSLEKDGRMQGPERLGSHRGVQYPRVDAWPVTWPVVVAALRRLRQQHIAQEQMARDDAARQAEIAVVRDACGAWALKHHPGWGVQRAAREGQSVVREVIEQIARLISAGLLLTPVWGKKSIEDQVSQVVSADDATFTAAYKTQDALAEIIKTIPCPSVITIHDPRVVRYHAPGGANHRVAVGISIEAVGSPPFCAIIAVPKEPQ